jgi:hypothetical protein
MRVTERSGWGLPVSIADKIRQMAAELGRQAEARTSHLKLLLAEVEARKGELQRQLNTARLSPERVFTFKPQIGPYFQCPSCWIESEKRSSLTPIGGSTRAEDFFRCRTCGFEITIQA